ncbi:DUF3558 domain-containing protein [Nocardia colli]|uniref:DUF3558 domain-containing protein n=1 Tax=Nocardia colli TaxID=2545717 RepID=UPI00168D24F0|nr:DUF3558 domain-containing protein [Nocardia colli]
MRIGALVGCAAVLSLVLTGCGSGNDSDNTSTPLRPPPKVAALGPFVGECGNVTDDEVRTLTGIGQTSQVLKNSVGCNWQTAGLGSPTVTFASYRGSPIAREKAWVTTQGRPTQTIDVGGRAGWQALEPDSRICDLAVQLDDDFFEWSMSFGLFAPPTANPCDLMHKLAELTVQRLK